MPITDVEKRKAYNKEYHSRPDVKERTNAAARARYHSGGKERKAEYDRVYRALDKTKARRSAYLIDRRKSNWAKVRVAELKVRARKIGVDFNLTEDDLVLPDVCPVFGVKLEVGVGKQGNNSPSVDRINPALGYIKGNIVVVSNRVNSLKREATIDELQKIVDFYLSLIHSST